METFEATIETEQAAQAMQHDGVHPDTLSMFLESKG